MTEPVVVQGEPVRARTADQPKTQEYTVRAGKQHRHDGVLYTGGQKVPLTEEQYKSFADKFEAPKESRSRSADDKSSDSGIGKGVADGKSPEERHDAMIKEMVTPRPKPTSHLPQDLGAKSPDPSAPRINEGNQVRRGGALAPAVTQASTAANREAAREAGPTTLPANADPNSGVGKETKPPQEGKK